MIRIILVLIMSLGSLLGFSQPLETEIELKSELINLKFHENDLERFKLLNSTFRYENITINQGAFEVSNTNLTFEIKL